MNESIGVIWQVVNKLSKAHVHATMQEYGVNYDRIWIYDKIHHEINQFCSRHTLQEVYIDKFDQVYQLGWIGAYVALRSTHCCLMPLTLLLYKNG